MRRSLMIVLAALFAVLLAACAPANTPAPAPTNPPQKTDGAKATDVPPAPTAVANTPQATTPAATPDIQKIVNVQPDDWKRGPDSATVKIIEWGDFQ